jgi:hypothetical protein
VAFTQSIISTAYAGTLLPKLFVWVYAEASSEKRFQLVRVVDAQLVGSCDRDTEGRDNKPT